ncbi:kinase-like domain-containing protein, partial [Pelagophyceae sp. CCMP2097]
MPTSGDFLKKRVIVNNYILLDSIGTGSYAEVRLCKEKQTDGLFAVKIINKELLQRRFAQPGGGTNKEAATMLDDVKREIAIMKKLSHPHVLRLYEVMDDPKVNKLYLVLEYMKRGDLMQLLNGNSKAYTCEPMSERALWHVFRQVGCGLEYLHLQNIVHGDIKPQNLLVGDDGVVKIADFGISKMISGDSSQARALVETSGTPAFMCPEICAGAAYQGFSADVWALGATMYMLRLGRPPFLADKVIQLYYKIIHDAVDYAAPEGQQALDAELRRLLGAMMTKDPLKRVDLAAVLADAWL